MNAGTGGERPAHRPTVLFRDRLDAGLSREGDKGLMDPDQLIEAVVVLIEESAPRRYHRDTGAIEPLTASEWDMISDRIMLLCAKNKPRVEAV